MIVIVGQASAYLILNFAESATKVKSRQAEACSTTIGVAT